MGRTAFDVIDGGCGGGTFQGILFPELLQELDCGKRPEAEFLQGVRLLQ